ncbi:MAG: CDP-alcohol phosphatidyltransferase family protein [Alphaproteobacteria bacterium]
MPALPGRDNEFPPADRDPLQRSRRATGATVESRAPPNLESRPGMSGKPTFSHFFAQRNDENQLAIDKLIANNISAFIAYIFHAFNITPNNTTVLSGTMGIFALILSIVLPNDQMLLSILIIYAAAQTSFILDCTDGLLARATNNSSKFGEFFDHTLDAFSFFIIFGGFFTYLYRHYLFLDNKLYAYLCLISGFFIIFTHTIRFMAWINFRHLFGLDEKSSPAKDGVAVLILKNFMDHQISLFGMLVFLIHPVAAFALYFTQGFILLGAYFRYFYRAYHSPDPGGN